MSAPDNLKIVRRLDDALSRAEYRLAELLRWDRIAPGCDIQFAAETLGEIRAARKEALGFIGGHFDQSRARVAQAAE